jgi:integrase/recombinase XerD
MRPDSLELLAGWTATLIARDLADRTIHTYSYAVTRLLIFHRFTVHPMDLTEGHVAAFLCSLDHHAPAKEQYAKGIASFTRWLCRHGYLAFDPVTEVTPRRRPRKPAVRYERDEVKRMLEVARLRDPSGRRSASILACLGLGTRRSEFTNIRRDDIDWARMRVHLRVTKGRRPRDVPIGPWAAEALHELEALSPTDQPYLIAIQPSTLNAWVHEAAISAEIVGDRKQRAHTLRASFASYLLEQAVPIPVVRDLLGHASIATTDAYAAAGPGAADAAVELLAGALV